MREKTEYTVITFSDYHAAIAFESFCREKEIPGRLIPLPSSVSAGCGMCWRMKPEEFTSWETVITDAGIPTEGSYHVMMW